VGDRSHIRWIGLRGALSDEDSHQNTVAGSYKQHFQPRILFKQVYQEFTKSNSSRGSS